MRSPVPLLIAAAFGKLALAILLFVVLSGCDSEPAAEKCPVGVYESTWSDPEPDCPELATVVAFGGATPIAGIGGACTGRSLPSQCEGEWDLRCERLGQQYTFAGSLHRDGTGEATLSIAGRVCHYTVENHVR